MKETEIRVGREKSSSLHASTIREKQALNTPTIEIDTCNKMLKRGITNKRTALYF